MLHVGLAVRVGSLMVDQTDLLNGDANGITNIPPENAGEIADVTPEFITAEEIIMNYVKAPGPKVVSKYDELRKEFQAAVKKLTARISRK